MMATVYANVQRANILADRADAEALVNNYVDAEALYRSSLELCPHHAGVLNSLGLVCHAQGKMNEAAESYRLSLSFSENGQTSRNLGQTLHDMGSEPLNITILEEAKNAYRKCIECDSTDVEGQIGLGQVLVLCGKFHIEEQLLHEAIEIFTGLLEILPGDERVLHLLGGVCGELGIIFANRQQFDQAIDSFDLSLEYVPNDEMTKKNLKVIYLNMGNEHLRCERYTEARVCYQRGLIAVPNDRDLLNNKKTATDSYENDLMRKGNDFLADKKYDSAIRMYRLILNKSPSNSGVINNLSIALQENGLGYFEDKQYIKAIKSFEQRLKLKPECEGTKDNLKNAKAMYRNEQMLEAHDYFEQSLFDKAIVCLRAALVVCPDDEGLISNVVASLEWLGNQCMESEHYVEALEHFQAALSLKDDEGISLKYGMAMYIHGECIYESDRALGIKKVTLALEKIPENDESYGEINTQLGVMLCVYGDELMGMKKVEEAIAMYERIDQTHPNYTQSRDKIEEAQREMGAMCSRK